MSWQRHGYSGVSSYIAIGGNGAGVHYRTDYTASMALGELVALSMLQEQAMFLREGSGDDIAFKVERFDGSQIKIKYDGSWETGHPPTESTYSAAESIGTAPLEQEAARVFSRKKNYFAD